MVVNVQVMSTKLKFHVDFGGAREARDAPGSRVDGPDRGFMAIAAAEHGQRGAGSNLFPITHHVQTHSPIAPSCQHTAVSTEAEFSDFEGVSRG